jgi:DNA polymerase III sliding clamp (beta) subunit (PCNA family)
MSQFTIRTSTLQSLVNKASKGAGNSSISALTSLVNVVLKNGTLTLTTTDTNNYFTVIQKDITGDDLNFTVAVDTFGKLISKTSSENIKIEVSDDVISITGNGTYKIPIQLDVDGSPIKYPNYTINNPDEEGSIKIATLKNITLHNKPCVAVTDEEPCLKGYYCIDGSVVSADSYNICKNDLKTFNSHVLISPTVVELLSISNTEEINYKLSDNNASFESENIRLFAHLMNGKETYDGFMETVISCAETEFPSECVLPKTALTSVIDRLALFINETDKNGLYMTFTNSGVKVESINGNGIENIPYQGSTNFKDFTCCIGVDSLKRQLGSILSENVKILYGNESIISIKADNAIHVISLLSDPRNE